MCGSNSQDSPSQGTKPIQTHGPDLLSDQGIGEYRPQLLPRPGGLSSGHAAVCISVSHWHGQRGHSPAAPASVSPVGTVRVFLFFDFSGAFKTIRPLLLRRKVKLVGVDQQLLVWISDYLTNRPQYGRLQDYTMEAVVCSTEAQQGTA